MPASSLPKLLLVIPFYNEEDRVDVKELEKDFQLYNEIDFLLVDDGSTDSTFSIINSLSKAHINVNHKKNKQNIGKAESIRKGVLATNTTSYQYIGYLDADMATPITEVVKLLEYAQQNPEKNIIMGTRIKLLGNQVKRSLMRHYLGRIFATIISHWVLKIPVYDTQCGAKIIKAQIADTLFEKPFYTKWLFDVELLLRLQKITDLYENVVEIPLDKWTEKGNSKIKWYEFVYVPIQIVKLYVKY